jgi:capsular polysaccharide biosynthesis protein
MTQLIYSTQCASQPDFPVEFRLESGLEPLVKREKDMVVLTGGNFSCLTKDGIVIKESTYFCEDTFFKKLSETQRVERLAGKWIVCGNVGSQIGFYHWFYQAFSGLLLLKKRGINLAEYNILVAKMPLWAQEYLRKIGVTNATEIDDQTLYIVEDATFTNTMWGYFSYRPHEELLSAYDDIGVSGYNCISRKIYISRDDSVRRKVVNEHEVIACLQKHGFKKIVLSECTIDEQIALFKNATEIVAPHGAGLTNLVYSKSGIRLIELFGEVYLNECFWAIAKKKNIDYVGLVNPMDPYSCQPDNIHFYNQIVDIDLLNNII